MRKIKNTIKLMSNKQVNRRYTNEELDIINDFIDQCMLREDVNGAESGDADDMIDYDEYDTYCDDDDRYDYVAEGRCRESRRSCIEKDCDEAFGDKSPIKKAKKTFAAMLDGPDLDEGRCKGKYCDELDECDFPAVTEDIDDFEGEDEKKSWESDKEVMRNLKNNCFDNECYMNEDIAQNDREAAGAEDAFDYLEKDAFDVSSQDTPVDNKLDSIAYSQVQVPSWIDEL